MPIIRRTIKLPFNKEFLMSLLSGSEGGLSTTAAIIAGLFISTDKPEIVVTSAVIAFSVQAFNGSISRLSTEHTENELKYETRWLGYRLPAYHAIMQFFAHMIMGTIVLLPIALVPSLTRALTMSIGFTLFFLFIIGFYKGRLAHNNPIREGLEMVILGSLVICVGIAAGIILTV